MRFLQLCAPRFGRCGRSQYNAQARHTSHNAFVSLAEHSGRAGSLPNATGPSSYGAVGEAAAAQLRDTQRSTQHSAVPVGVTRDIGYAKYGLLETHTGYPNAHQKADASQGQSAGSISHLSGHFAHTKDSSAVIEPGAQHSAERALCAL